MMNLKIILKINKYSYSNIRKYSIKYKEFKKKQLLKII